MLRLRDKERKKGNVKYNCVFVPKKKYVFMCPNNTAIGMSKTINSPFNTNGGLMAFYVQILKQITIYAKSLANA